MMLVKYISEIKDILNREIRSLTTVLELEILEEKSRVKNDNQMLIDFVERQEDVFSSRACLEKSRMEILDKISEETGETVENITVSKLAELVNNPLKKELVENGYIMSGLHEDIQRKKASNTMLINQAIMFVESDIRTIFNSVNQKDENETIYTSQAGSDNIPRSVCIDKKR